jgi:hypothetical protein
LAVALLSRHATVCLWLAVLLAADAGGWTIYDRRGRREAEVRESMPGRYDVYDRSGKRLGSGIRSPIDGDIQFYDTRGNRTIQVVPRRAPDGKPRRTPPGSPSR